jgi:TatD DNase family protein
MIDTHAHLDFSDFDSDREDIIKECAKQKITIINPGTDIKTSAKAVELANQYKNIYASVGLHPSDSQEPDFDYTAYKQLINSKVVAIGEMGLDFWYLEKEEILRNAEIKRQKEIFIKQLDLANEMDLPAIIHCRVAFNEVLEILKQRKNRGVIHCFTGNWEQAQQFLDLGFYLGINGIIFKMNLEEVIKNCPIDKILLETDCPFLAPPQFEKRNSPLALNIIVEKVAKLKNMDMDELIQATDLNAKTLFKV